MSEQKRKSSFYVSTSEKADKTKKQYVMNAWSTQFEGLYSLTINQELTEEQWVEIYREVRKGKEGKLWLNMNATKQDSAPKKTKETSDEEAPF